MQQITGRLVEDAKVTTTKSGKQFVNFAIADNDSYRAKGGTEATQVVTYFNCSYWITTKVAEWLKKGMTVLLSGRAGTNAYLNKDGEPVAKLTFLINNIKVLSFPAKKDNVIAEAVLFPTAQTVADIADDLPF